MERVQKIIANYGIMSRRKAEALILKGKVKVNGQVIKIGDKASVDDHIMISDKLVTGENKKLYFVLNKPVKTITTSDDPQKRKTVVDLINIPERIFPVGRLDYNTTGVLLLTNDGELAHKLTHPSFEIVRVYRARITEPLLNEELNFLNSKNVKIDNKISIQKVTIVNKKSYIISMHQGYYHHIKKLFMLVGKKVLNLTRIEYAGINVIGMKKGEYRSLKLKEIKWLKKITSK